MAGTAAAVADNSLGVAGVAPQADIMAVRVLDGNGSGITADIADGILFASNEGAGVINMSLGGPSGGGDTVMSNAATVAEQRGTVIVAAAGNEGSNNDVSPTTPVQPAEREHHLRRGRRRRQRAGELLELWRDDRRRGRAGRR